MDNPVAHNLHSLLEVVHRGYVEGEAWIKMIMIGRLSLTYSYGTSLKNLNPKVCVVPLSVRRLGFHPGKTSSILVRRTNFIER